MVHNPNNWHWVDKNCFEWSKEYFEKNLIGTEVTIGPLDEFKNGLIAKVTKLDSFTGDVDVSQRKGKVISLFDTQITLSIQVSLNDKKNKEESESKDELMSRNATVKIPEVAYDTEPSEYVFELEVLGNESENVIKSEQVRQIFRNELEPILRKKLSLFGPELIKTHSGDIQIPVEKVNSPFTRSQQEGLGVGKNSKSKEDKNMGKVDVNNVSSVRVSANFAGSAKDIYKLLTDKELVRVWSRGEPVAWDLRVGGKFSIFGGNISGEFTKFIENKLIESTWREKNWKDGYYAKLHVSLVEKERETEGVWSYDGVPVGQEDIVRGNTQSYYVDGIKRVFGL